MKHSLKHSLKTGMACVLSAAMLVSAAPSVFAVPEKAAAGINVDPYTQYQTLEGWGTSLCWWGNTIGSWVDENGNGIDYNGNGKADRDEVAELAFSPEYLNLNIVRYNVGGGDAPGHWEPGSDSYHMKRCEGRVPGWTSDMYYDENGNGVENAADGTYDEEKFMSKTVEEMNDPGQLWMLEQANKYREAYTGTEGDGQTDIINKVFSNSPPYYMTYSGCSTGNTSSNKDNLRSDQYDNFAEYLTRAAKWVNKDLTSKFGENAAVDYIEPMNEPGSTWWGAHSSKQEGCHFSPGQTQIDTIAAQQRALVSVGLNHVKITGTDEYAVGGGNQGNAIDSWNKLTPETRAALDTISAHTYGGSNTDRSNLRDLAASYDKGVWMSEVCRGGGQHFEDSHDSMTQTRSSDLSSGIVNDLKYMQPSAWIAWMVADSEYECIQTNSNWGLIQAVFEADGPEPSYHKNLFNADGSVKDSVPPAGSWYITKQLYTLMQYSKYLKAGYTMVEVGDSSMVGAVSPDGKELVIVADNINNNSERPVSLNLSKLQNAAGVTTYRTSEVDTGEVQNYTTGDTTECCTEVRDAAALENSMLTSTLPKNSISTFVVKAGGTGTLLDTAQSIKTVNDRVVYNEESTDELDKFQYSEGWTQQTSNGAYSGNLTTASAQGASVTFKFSGERALIIGEKHADGAVYSVTVDAEPIDGSFSAQSPAALSNQLLYDTGKLSSGEHTVTLTAESGGTLAIDCAKLITGDVDLFDAPVVEKVGSYEKALLVSFSTSFGAASYSIKYGEAEDNLDQKIENVSSPAAITGLENDKTYYVQVEASDKEGSVKQSAVVSAAPAHVSSEALYYVDCGKESADTLLDGQLFGTLSSSLDQPYAADLLSNKKWGYISSSSGGTGYGDSGEWESVRYNSSKSAGSVLTYQFELEPGKYLISVGAYDPWNNKSRMQVITCQGETMTKGRTPSGEFELQTADSSFAPGQDKKEFRSIVEIGADESPLLSIAATVAKNGNDNSILSYIRVEKYDENAIDVIADTAAAAIEGQTPSLPDTVNATTLGGASVTPKVTWNTKDVDFTAEPYQFVTVTGTVEGTAKIAKASVQIIPKYLKYFIDCNNEGSLTYTNANAVTEGGLVNLVPDQLKTAENTWGSTSVDSSGFGGNTADPYSGGLYANNGTAITYDVTLPAGTYEISAGFTGWWNMNRDMTVSYSYEGLEKTKLFDVTAPRNSTIAKGAAITLPEEKAVTITVEKAAKDDPILSWLSVAEVRLESVSVKSAPVKVEYSFGEELDLSGLVLEAAYSDGSAKEITDTALMVVTGYDKNTVGVQTVTVSYEGKTTSFEVTVNELPTEPSEPTTPTEPTEPTAPGERYMLGDINEDGSVTLADVLDMQNYLAKSINLTERQLFVGDVDRSGRISLADILEIQKYLAHMPTNYEVGKIFNDFVAEAAKGTG